MTKELFKHMAGVPENLTKLFSQKNMKVICDLNGVSKTFNVVAKTSLEAKIKAVQLYGIRFNQIKKVL